jgi:anti-sigma regulatory factor (Ser/Thr protein kinase)
MRNRQMKINTISNMVAPLSAQLTLKSGFDDNQLANVRTFIDNFCQYIPGLPASDNRIAKLKFALIEVITNITKHAYQGRPGQWIRIKACFFENKFTFLISDKGRQFFPKAIKRPKPGQVDKIGLFIIEQSMDTVNYERDEKGRNCTRLEMML